MPMYKVPKLPILDVFLLWILLFFFGPFIFVSRVLFNTSLEVERVFVLLALFFFILFRRRAFGISARFILLAVVYFLSLIISMSYESAFRYVLVIPLVYFVTENLVSAIYEKVGFYRTLVAISVVVLLTHVIILIPFAFLDSINVLNFYTTERLEEFGIKSNYVGWSCAVLVPIFLLLIKHYRNIQMRVVLSGLIFLSFVLILGSGSRSGALSVLLSLLVFFISNFRRYSWLLLLCITSGLCGYFLILRSQSLAEVSFVERHEKIVKGIANDDYRILVYSSALETLRQIEDPRTWFGYGANNFDEYLQTKNPALARYRLSSHSTYVEMFVSFGVLGFILLFVYFVVKPLMTAFRLRFLYLLIPVGVISLFENNLGPGQFLFGTFIVYSVLFYSHASSSRSRPSLS